MRLVAAAVCVASVASADPRELRERIAADRPVTLDLLPDVTEEARWPLAPSSHPALEPHFAIAAELAEPGVTWQDLCARGAARRTTPSGHELTEYLGAWCDVLAHDDDAAIGALARLRDTGRLGMTDAVVLDLADILAEHGSADDAERLMAAHRVSDIRVIDALAATYDEISRPDDAAEINRLALETDHDAPLAMQCHRLARQIVLEPARRALALKALDATIKDVKAPDRECVRIDHELTCWNEPWRSCSEYVSDAGLPDRTDWLIEDYYRWPDGPASFEMWIDLAEQLALAPRTKGAIALESAALRAAMVTSACEGDPLDRVTHILTFGPQGKAIEDIVDEASSLRHMKKEKCAVRIAR
ncbi:MAG TPA: hypothetical protein VLX92_22375 [Kofleriaceae bacterium]|nr:hypothetical protein [Kofleriaceae bacterium]